MKKILLSAAAIASMLFAASCQKEISSSVQDGDVVTATITVQAPDALVTKSVGDGKSADNLVFAVYDETGEELPALRLGDWANSIGDPTPVTFNEDLTATVTVQLARGKEYSFVCWAQNVEATCYNFSDMKNIRISYETYNASNNDLRDAFYAKVDTKGKVTQNFSQEITLHRPFGQINVGTTDFAAAKNAGLEITDLFSSMTVKNAATVLETFTGKAKSPEAVTLDWGHAPAEALVINKALVQNNPQVEIADSYGWLAMNYILVADGTDNGASSALAEVAFSVREGENTVLTSYEVPNVPVQRNFRTNIVGGLLTAEGEISIIIDPIFNGEYVINVWDGYTVEAPASDENGYYVTKASELAWVAQQVNEAGKTFENETVYLAADIDLAGQVWTPIGAGETAFKGTFEVLPNTSLLAKSVTEYYAIYGLNVEYTEGPAGLFGWIDGGAVKNVTLVAPQVSGKSYVAAVAGKIFTTGLVENCTVKGGLVYGNHYVAGVAAHAYGSVNYNTVDGTIITGKSIDEDLDGDKVGGIVGLHAADAEGETVKGNKVLNVTVVAKRDAAAVAGAANASNVTENHVEKATVGSAEAEISNAGVIVGRVLAGALNPKANTYNHETITVNGQEVKPAVAEFKAEAASEEVLPVEGGKYVITITANVPWTVTVPEGLTAAPAAGEGNAEVVVTVPATELTEPNPVTYEVVVATEEEAETKSFEFTIKQTAAEPVLEDGQYWIVTNGKYAMPLTSNYGYIQVNPYGFLDNVFTIKAVAGGYTIQDASGQYYYQTGTYDSFNRAATKPANGAVWTITLNEDGSCKILNNAVNKYVQYDTQYNSYGSYATAKGVMPTLVKAEGARERMEPSAWGVIGVNGDWNNDITMFIKDNYFVAYDVEIKSGSFKFRKDKAWTVNYGGESKINTAVMTVDSGADITVPAGTYDLYLDVNAHAYWVMTAGQLPTAPDFKIISVYAATTYTNLYSWSASGAVISASWPGSKYEATEEIAGTSYKKWTLIVDQSTFAKTAQFIFNNGSTQTADSKAFQLADEMFFNVSGTAAPTLTDRPVEEVTGGGKADFATVTATNTSYVTGKTTAGWNYKNCAIFKGGTSDSSPAFKMIGDAANRALCMNGKTSAVGSITSPAISGGCGTLTFNYGLPFSDTKIKFRVDIIQDGATVHTFTVDKATATKLTKYSHEEEVNVAGEFQIVFTNLSPSNSTSNKDRTAIWDVEWTGCAK